MFADLDTPCEGPRPGGIESRGRGDGDTRSKIPGRSSSSAAVTELKTNIAAADAPDPATDG
eukprot:6001776-Prorocentrum_lima.AAC.1